MKVGLRYAVYHTKEGVVCELLILTSAWTICNPQGLLPIAFPLRFPLMGDIPFFTRLFSSIQNVLLI